MAKKTINVGETYTQTRAVEKDGRVLFDYVGEDFLVEKYDFGIVRCRGVNGIMTNCILGIGDDVFFDFFDIKKQKESTFKEYFLKIMRI